MDDINQVFNRTQQVGELQEIHFQSLSWNDGDFEKEEDSDFLQYEIYISGVDKIGRSVCAKVIGFTPYFYVLVPETWTKREAELFYKHIKTKLYNLGYGLVSFDFVKKKKLFPYLAEKQFKFVRLVFNTLATFNKCKWMFTKKNQEEKPIKISGIDHVKYYEPFETNINPLNRFCHVLGIETTGWLKITKFQEDLEYTSAQINVVVFWKDIQYDPDTKSIAPLTVFSWDIECRPENTEEFPNPEVPGDVIKQISVVLIKYTTSIKQSFIFTSSPCSAIKLCGKCGKAADNKDQIECLNIVMNCSKQCKKMCENEKCKQICGSTKWENAIVVESEGEEKLLQNFCNFIGMVDPDILIGFNTWGFDDIYFWKRATKIYNIDISKLSRINQINPKLTKKELSSSAYGNNEFNYLFCPGRETFDMLVAIRREHKLESTSLNYVSKYFLKEKKLDLPYRILFEKLNGGPDEIAECSAYCIHDSNLTVRLFLKLNMLPNYVAMAKTTYVPMEWLLFRGQQCKVFSLIIKEARSTGYVIPVHEKTDKNQGFKGATVINPMIGMYYDPIAGLDFASLYPSIMIALNLCYTTFISPEMMPYVIENGIPYKTIEWISCTEKDCKNPDCHHEKQNYSYSFVQIEDDQGKEIPKGIRGILGTILMRLMKGRRATKKLMAAEQDPFMKDVYNGKQLAEKVTMNSGYGFTGAENGILPLKPIAACVTATGRKMIDKTSKIAGEKFGALTIYGDSIPGYEKITVSKKEPGRSGIHFCLGIHDISISEFADKISTHWKEYRGFKVGDTEISNKEYKDTEKEEYYTMTHKGYQKIKKVIRHQTNKKLYKIKARDSNGKIHQVVVTEGHSLILPTGEMITAEDVKIGTKLFDYQT